jgi:hypothetical protein
MSSVWLIEKSGRQKYITVNAVNERCLIVAEDAPWQRVGQSLMLFSQPYT